MNELLKQKMGKLIQTARYENSGSVTLKVLKLKGIPFGIAIIVRYRESLVAISELNKKAYSTLRLMKIYTARFWVLLRV